MLFFPHRFTCPFVEKFSIDIETYYKTDAGENPNVFSLSPVERSQLVIGNVHHDAPALGRAGALLGRVGVPCPWAPVSQPGRLPTCSCPGS